MPDVHISEIIFTATAGFNEHHSFVEIDHEIFSMAILSLPLAKECAQYWFTAKRTRRVV